MDLVYFSAVMQVYTSALKLVRSMVSMLFLQHSNFLLQYSYLSVLYIGFKFWDYLEIYSKYYFNIMILHVCKAERCLVSSDYLVNLPI